MSRIGLKPLEIPKGVEVKIEEKSKYGGQKIVVKGPLGELVEHLRKDVTCKMEEETLFFERTSDSKGAKSKHGLYRTLVANMITGVVQGFEKQLEIVGIGYKAELKGDELELNLEATHPYKVKAPEGISFEVEDKVNIKVKGINKQLVGQVAANIRALAIPEPYKGKGIRYKGEYVRKKAGKVAKTADEGGE